MGFIADNIEQIENIVELIVLAVCTALVFGKRSWPSDEIRLFVRGFFGIGLLADLYWTVFTLVFGYTPPYFYVAELGWVAQELFLLLLIYEVYRSEGRTRIRPVSWVVPATVAALTVWFVVATGSAVTNTLMGAALAYIGLISLNALIDSSQRPAGAPKRHCCLYATALGFVIAEHIIWTCSVLDASVSVTNPYYWFDPLVTVSYALILLCVLRLGAPSGEADD